MLALRRSFAARPALAAAAAQRACVHLAPPMRALLVPTSRGLARTRARPCSAPRASSSSNPVAGPGWLAHGHALQQRLLAQPFALFGRRLISAAAQLPLPRAPLELPGWMLRLPLVGAMLQHLRFRPTWPGHAAFALSGLSFLVTDMLWLRAIASLSCLLAIGFNWFHPVGKTLWLPVYWNVAYIVVNAVYIAQILKERAVSLSALERQIYREHFDGALSVSDFKRLLDAGSIRTACGKELLLVRGRHPQHLVLVFDGHPCVEVEAGISFTRANGLVGEMSFLHGGEASATVHVSAGSRYVVWERAALDAWLEREPAMRRGIELAIARELMRKLAHSNKELVRATRLAEYSRFVSRAALRVQLGARAERDASCDGFFELLRAQREAAGVTGEMHARVLADFGVDEATCRREQLPAGAVCGAIVAAADGAGSEADGGARNECSEGGARTAAERSAARAVAHTVEHALNRRASSGDAAGVHATERAEGRSGERQSAS